MGLVDYSESDSSGSEAEAAPPITTTTKPRPSASSSKKPFQKVVDRSNPGKIVLNLPQADANANANDDDQPPAKRAKTAGPGAGRFSGFSSFLPAPKNAGAAGRAAGIKPTASSQTRPGVNLRTSAAPGFSRDALPENDDGGGGSTDDAPNSSTGASSSAGLSLPPPKKQAEPSIPEGLKSEEEVKLVGKPMMFRPLSVARNANKKKKTTTPKPGGVSKPAAPQQASINPLGASKPSPSAPAETNGSASPAPRPPPPKKVSLFSMHTDLPSEPSESTSQPNGGGGGGYEPLFDDAVTGPYDSYYTPHATHPTVTTDPSSSAAAATADSVDTIANDLNLSASARRDLFGRSGAPAPANGAAASTAKRVINFNMDREYQHNEEVRAAGEQQIHNPVRSIQGGGKHSLQQLVQKVHSQRDALEDSFAKGKTNRKEASGRYGW